jgi:hypothetical protein
MIRKRQGQEPRPLQAPPSHRLLHVDLDEKILGSADANGVPTHLIHLLGWHPDPSGHSLIYVRNDIRVKSIPDAVLPDQPPKYRAFLDTGTM